MQIQPDSISWNTQLRYLVLVCWKVPGCHLLSFLWSLYVVLAYEQQADAPSSTQQLEQQTAVCFQGK